MKITEKISGTVRKPAAYLAAEWERMAPRQRRLIGALGGVVGALVLLLGSYFYFGSLADLAEVNADMREALAEIAKRRDGYLDAKSKVRAQEVRLGKDPPQLAADLETAAREVGVQIPEQNERPAVPAGRFYMEHAVDLKLRQVDLLGLTKFLLKLETGPRFIQVTRLGIRRRFSEGEKLDVDLTVNAYERVKEDTKNKRPGRGSKT